MTSLLNYEPEIIKFGTPKNKEAGIYKMMKNVSENTIKISTELSERQRINSKIQAKLDLMRHVKQSLSENQIENFAKFITLSNYKGLQLSEILEKLDESKDLKSLRTNADYAYVFNTLREITRYQKEALSCLKTINIEGDNILHIL